MKIVLLTMPLLIMSILPALAAPIIRMDTAEIGTNEKLLNGAFTGSAKGWLLTNFDYSTNRVIHAGGSAGTISQPIHVTPYKAYLVAITLTTSTPGSIWILMGGADITDGMGAVRFENGTLTNTTMGWYSFTSTGTNNFSIVTDTIWAGSIDNISIIEVKREFEQMLMLSALDDPGGKIPNGIKFGRFNAGNISLGDNLSAQLQQNPAAWNVAIGSRTLQFNQNGMENTAIGSFALRSNQSSRNTALGYSALRYNTIGEFNTGLGYKAGFLTTTGSYNTSVGMHSLMQNQTSGQNTALGYQALYNVISTGFNTAVGMNSGLNSRGSENTYLGASAGLLNTDANVTYTYNRTTSLGSATKVYGSDSTAVGYMATIGAISAPAINSVSVGRSASAAESDSVAIGTNASATHQRNTAIGFSAQAAGSEQATAVGFGAKADGRYSTTLGSQAGIAQTGDQSTFIGAFAGNDGSAKTYSNATCIGYDSHVSGNNQVQLGDSRTTTYAYGAIQNRSDMRDKADIRDTLLGLDFICKLRPVDFRWNFREDYKGQVNDGSRKRPQYHHGLIAQEVKQITDTLKVDFGGYHDASEDGGNDVLSIGYDELIAPLIKAIQELNERIKVLEASKAASSCGPGITP